jgi:hypothetical protein
VRISTDSASCSDCHFCENYLLPCRHVFAANLVKWPNFDLFHVGQCHVRWRLDKPAVRPVSANDLVTVPLAAAIRQVQPADDDAGRFWTELSNNALHVNFMAKAARLSGFLKAHGEQAYVRVQQQFDQLVEHYSKTAPPGRRAAVQVRIGDVIDT